MKPTPDVDSLVVGIHPVEELLKTSPQKVNRLLLLQSSGKPALYELQKKAEQHNIRVNQLPQAQLLRYYKGQHQGAIAVLHERVLEDWKEFKPKLKNWRSDGKPVFGVLLSHIEDPRNFGACIRSTVGMGCDFILFPNKGTSGLTAAAAKASAGSFNHIPICCIGQVQKELMLLKEEGFQVIGLDARGKTNTSELDLSKPSIFIAGGEDKGIPNYIRRTCDSLVKLPIHPKAHSFNTSVALSLLLYDVASQEKFSRIPG